MDGEEFNRIGGFDWDKGNIEKNWLAHRVGHTEGEEIFFSEPLLIFEDIGHSGQEKRFYALGQTNEERKLFVVFTMRNSRVRIISVRDMSKKERKMYAKETAKNSPIS